jgi:GSH-dependent disulfide-bond oxidoreductase
MIDLYYWPTPNGHKITLMLEECGLAYRIHPINIGAGDQFQPDFLRLSPNNRMPAIIDHAPNDGGEPVRIFESGAILLYLAEKTGQFLASDLRTRYQTIQWLMWQMGGLGPMAGQNHHFNLYAPEPIPYAQERYTKETARLYHVLDVGLEGRDFLAGSYSVADMACYPWIVPHRNQQQNLDDFPNVKAWFTRIGSRPATVKAYAVGEGMRPSRPPTDEERQNMFGEKQKRR